MAESTTSANVSAAISALRATTPTCPCAAPKIPPWAKNGGAGWHPERVKPLASSQHLIIGGGPAGLEAVRTLIQRGAEVTLAEARETLGGRVTLESALPSLAEWARVREWRIGQLNDKPNAQLYTQSPLTADDILNYGISNVALSTQAGYKYATGFGEKSAPLKQKSWQAAPLARASSRNSESPWVLKMQ